MARGGILVSLFGVWLLSLLILETSGGCEISFSDNRTNKCLGIILLRNNLTDIQNFTSSISDSKERACCDGHAYVTCLEESIADNCSIPVSQRIELIHGLINQSDSPSYDCSSVSEENCEEYCIEDEFEKLEEKCRDIYNSKLIHILEDPNISHDERPNVLCCALKEKGLCIIKAALETGCKEDLQENFEQPKGLTEEFGYCDFFDASPCSASISHVCVVLLYLSLLISHL